MVSWLFAQFLFSTSDADSAVMSSPNAALTGDHPLTKLGDDELSSRDKTHVMEDGDLSTIPNPYCFSQGRLFDGLTYNGVPVQRIPVDIGHVENIKRIRSLAKF